MRRSHLVGGYEPATASSGGSQFGSQYGSQLVEEENDKMADVLSDKVKALKSLSIDIGNEVREQNKFLKSMDTDFDNSGGFLRSTMSRVTAMARAGHNCHIFYLLLFACFVFFICWLIIKTR
jgi:blocked-early-in-transport protein 1